tara:strand:+ start:10396 stop:10530 length:135 start_codon:yes stop_codon:yes gene_type:complete
MRFDKNKVDALLEEMEIIGERIKAKCTVIKEQIISNRDQVVTPA